jgi:hypothetical protein
MKTLFLFRLQRRQAVFSETTFPLVAKIQRRAEAVKISFCPLDLPDQVTFLDGLCLNPEFLGSLDHIVHLHLLPSPFLAKVASLFKISSLQKSDEQNKFTKACENSQSVPGASSPGAAQPRGCIP